MKNTATDTIHGEKHQRLVRMLLEGVRGERRQNDLSRRLGYRSNQWHKWESGQTAFMWKDLVKVTRTLELPLQEAVDRVIGHRGIAAEDGKAFFVEIWKKYVGNRPNETRPGVRISRAKLSRITRGRQDLELALVFGLLDEMSTTLPFFVDALCPSIPEKSIRKELSRFRRQVSDEADVPWACALEAALESRAYQSLRRHDDGTLAEQLGIPKAMVARGLAALRESEAIRLDRGKYVLNSKRVDMDPDIRSSARLARFWTEICLERFNETDGVPASRRGWSYRIFPVSSEARRQLYEAQLEFARKILRIAQEDRDRPKSLIQAVMLHLFDSDEMKASGALGRSARKWQLRSKTGN